MIHGRFHDGFPHLTLELPITTGTTRGFDFILDSGFEGDLTLPPDLLPGLDMSYAGELPFALADLTLRTRPVYQILLEWQGEERIAAIVAMEGNPLLGVGLLRGNLVQMEMDEGGEVTVEVM